MTQPLTWRQAAEVTTLLPEVAVQARVLHHRHRPPAHVDIADSVQAGTLGLIDAVQRFDPSRGASLRTFVRHRIRGAVLDRFREDDPLGRISRQHVRAGTVQFSVAQLEHLPPATLAQLQGPASTAEADVLRRQVDALLQRTLRPREAFVIRAHFFDGQPLHAIGASLGVSQGRVSHLKARALRRLRLALEAA